ncbi:hypothetical protein SAMN02990966_04115 [Rhodospirillales bacterium URHD0017]|nr:hypothetical protein SAMN02990966_04115 [Rhodospirillales bacterium URHD0017]
MNIRHFHSLAALIVLVCIVCEGAAQNVPSKAAETPYAVNCERPADHDAADLCEQRRQAQAAEDAVFWARVGFFAVAVSLAFTGWAAVAAGRAAVAAESSVKISSQNAQTELRAYVFVKRIVCEAVRQNRWTNSSGAVVEGPIVAYNVFAELENSGATPTRHLVLGLGGRMFNEVMPSDWNYPDVHTESAIMGPHTTFNSARVSVSAAEMKRLSEKGGHEYIWGWVDYNDVFEGTPRHRTEFCFEITADPHPSGGDITLQFPAHGPFNAAEEDCVRTPQPYRKRSSPS